MAKKKIKITKKVKEVDQFIEDSDRNVIAVGVLLNNAEPYGGLSNLLSKKNKTAIFNVIINSMAQYADLETAKYPSIWLHKAISHKLNEEEIMCDRLAEALKRLRDLLNLGYSYDKVLAEYDELRTIL